MSQLRPARPLLRSVDFRKFNLTAVRVKTVGWREGKLQGIWQRYSFLFGVARL